MPSEKFLTDWHFSGYKLKFNCVQDLLCVLSCEYGEENRTLRIWVDNVSYVLYLRTFMSCESKEVRLLLDMNSAKSIEWGDITFEWYHT